MIYDIIGDIHGQADKLIGLLNKLGYHHDGTSHVPPKGHQAIFIGDFVDRGSRQLDTLKIVFAMLDNHHAQAVMGNHEYNALAYATPDIHNPTGGYLRPHSLHNTIGHQAFLDEIPFGSSLHQYWLNRFYELPLWLETDDCIFIHACYDTRAIDTLKPYLTTQNQLTPDALQATGRHRTPSFLAIEHLLKGLETTLPQGMTMTDKTGITRTNARIKWWVNDWQRQPMSQVLFADDLPNTPLACLSDTLANFYINTTKPIFIGHYWLHDTPTPLSSQVVCTDYSAGKDGHLTAYRFDTTNPTLSADNFIQYIEPLSPVG